MEQLQAVLFAISNAFLLPVLLAVLAVFIYTTYLVGQFLSEGIDRRKNAKYLGRLYEGKPTRSLFLEFPWKGELGEFRASVERLWEESSLLEKRIVDLENGMRRRVERLGILARTGPILGLVGTLIPLQPALAALARGNMNTMGANLLIGFTTTVIGLLVGGTCFAIAVVVRNWHQHDLTEICFLMDQWKPEPESPEEAKKPHETLKVMATRAAVGGRRLEIQDRPVRRPQR